MLKWVVSALVAITAATPLSAEVWAYAESSRFRVYSEGGEESARVMASKLERLDDAMRLFTGTKPATSATSENTKVTIYQFGNSEAIGKLAGMNGVVGFFIPRAGESVAFVPLAADRERPSNSSPGARQGYEFYQNNIDPESVLFHEYAHYFMYQHAPAAYPGWYSEGFAELFGTLKLEPKGFTLGEPAEHRKAEISMVQVDADKMFDTRARYITFPQYGHGWLAVSYLSFKPERQGQLANYLSALNRGVEGRQAAREAFGDLEQLERELNAYRRQRALGLTAQFASQSEPIVSVRRLSTAEAARMPLRVRAKAGVTREQARGMLAEARRLAIQFPESLPVQLTALEAEVDAGELAEAEERAVAVLAKHPKSVETHLFRGQIAMEHARNDPKWLLIARSHFVSANNIDSAHPQALTGYYLSFQLANETPPENALIALESAFDAAPFDSSIRELLSHLLLVEKRDAQARVVLAPIAYRPHGGAKGRKLRELLAKLEEGERKPLLDELAPSLKKEKS